MAGTLAHLHGCQSGEGPAMAANERELATWAAEGMKPDNNTKQYRVSPPTQRPGTRTSESDTTTHTAVSPAALARLPLPDCQPDPRACPPGRIPCPDRSEVSRTRILPDD